MCLMLPPIKPSRFFPVLFLLALLLSATHSALAEPETDSPAPTTSGEISKPDGEPQKPDFDRGLDLLKAKSFNDKKKAVDLLANSGDERAITYLQLLLNARLYYLKDTKAIVAVERKGKEYLLSDPISTESLGTVPKKKIKKITINNSLRGKLREKIASLSLANPDPDIRYDAVNQMINSKTPGLSKILSGLMPGEKNARVKDLMDVGIKLGALQSGPEDEKLDAIAALSGNLHPAVRNALVAISEDDAESQKVKEATATALTSIEKKVRFYANLETLFFGLSLGSVLVLAAIGLAITFGVMGVINMAHGELIMLGAYTTYIIQQLMPEATNISILIAIPAAFIVSGLMGILIERSVIRFLYGRPLETLLATFGISLILQQLVRSLISPQNVPVSNPDWLSGSLQINSVFSITYNRLYILIFSLLVFALLYLVLKKTRLGLQVRAVSQNRAMARAMGVRSGRVDALTFGLGSGIAGVAGVALSQLTNVGPNLGQAYIIDSFMVVVFGGVGNLFGTLVAGLTLGVANKIIEPWAGAVLAKILVLIFIILFIQKYPRGLFPQKGRAAEN